MVALAGSRQLAALLRWPEQRASVGKCSKLYRCLGNLELTIQ